MGRADRRQRASPVRYAAKADLLEILIRLFADRLLVAVRRGLPHRYRPREEDLQFLRGKLDISRQLTHHAVRPDRLACRFEELSVDTPLNRVLKAAVSRLASVSASDRNLRRLAELAARFEFVGRSPAPAREPVRLDRTNTAFHRLYRLARALLGNEWQSTTTGDSEGFGLLFPMNDLFEAFVGRTMRAVLAPRSVQSSGLGILCLGRRPRTGTPVRATARHRGRWRHRHRHQVETAEGWRNYARRFPGRRVSDARLCAGVSGVGGWCCSTRGTGTCQTWARFGVGR